MKILFMDDMESRHQSFREWCSEYGVVATHVKTAQAAIQAMEKERFDKVFLDHDLGEQHYLGRCDKECGCEVVDWMIATIRPTYEPEATIVHSYNSSAAKRMMDALLDSNFNSGWVPFGPSLKEFLKSP